MCKIESKRENLNALRECANSGKDEVSSLPAVLYLEATAVCNLRCPMCPTTMGIPRDPYRASLFQMDLLAKVEPILPAVSRCFLSGGGEPLLHPRFFELVSALVKQEIEIHFNTNATLLDEKIAQRLIDSRVHAVSFSVDAATAKTYEQIRRPAKFKEVVRNIRRLADLKAKSKQERPWLNMQFTVQKANRREIKAAVKLAADLGINHLVIEPLTPVFCFDPEYRAFYKEHAVPGSELMDDLRDARTQARKLGIFFSSHYLWRSENPDPPRVCFQPWLTFGVRVDGRVFTCCGTLERMGDLARESFAQIWNGEKYRSLRRTLAAGGFPEFCRFCIEENRANHFNEDLLNPGPAVAEESEAR